MLPNTSAFRKKNRTHISPASQEVISAKNPFFRSRLSYIGPVFNGTDPLDAPDYHYFEENRSLV